MTAIKTVGVRYVGTKPLKKDVVNKSLVVWFGENDVQQVPENEAKKLFQFPDVFQPEEVKPLDRPNKAQAAPVTTDPVVPDADKGENEGGEAGAQEQEPGESTENTNTEPVSAEEIAGILGSMDRTTEFTQQNRPKLDALRARFPGRSVTSTAVKAAWTQFTGD